jgi:PIN domain nuclease of toxin-antitoxin system
LAQLLIDTQILVWVPSGDPRLRRTIIEALADANSQLFVSAVVAFEFADLQQRRRIAVTEEIATLAQIIDFSVIDLPARCWETAVSLPDIHRDPVDRMLIAHAIVGGFTLVTSDQNIHKYPVPVIC